MRIIVQLSTTVQPARETPRHFLWISNIDLLQFGYHTPIVLFYTNPTHSSYFFDPKVLKDALSRTIVQFYPLAGRLRRDENGRIEIDCNGAGVLFVEAESDGVLADFGDFTPTLEFRKLVPHVDDSQGISMYPLFVVQVTYFKCGGVCLGVGLKHLVADGTSYFHFLNTWSRIARGLDNPIPPFINRTILRARDPPQPMFHVIENQSPPTMKIGSSETIEVSTFKLTRDQIHSLKAKTIDDENVNKYSTFETLAGHLWRCYCRARGLSDNQETKLYIPINGRTRLHSLLPPGYFGNVVMNVTSIALAADLLSNPNWYAASRIHETLARMDNDNLRSRIEYIEVQRDLKTFREKHVDMFKGPDHLQIISWTRLPIHETDFGWGRPIFTGPGLNFSNGLCMVLPSPTSDGSLYVLIGLQAEHMNLFAKYLYVHMNLFAKY